MTEQELPDEIERFLGDEPNALRASQIGRLLALAGLTIRRQAIALDDLCANHRLAAGIIAGMAHKYERPDMTEHAARMIENLDAVTAASPATATAVTAEPK